jgi:ABC-type dipeptide/oligopeptide/nickel transport system permease component
MYMEILNYIIRRTLWFIPVLIIISLLTFVIMHLVPGSPFDTADKPLPDDIIKNLEDYYNLNEPLLKQYVTYIWNVLHGDLGPSYLVRGRSVNEIIKDHFPISFQLGVVAFFVAIFIGVPLGIISAVRQNSITDYIAMFFAISGVSIPHMTLGPLLIWFFALKLKWLPVARWGSWRHVILPAFALGIGAAARIARLTRASILQTLPEDYIRTAKAKGVSETKVILKHALRNSLIPVVTILGPLLASLVTGTLVIEQIFAIPGMGKFFVQSVNGRNYPVIMGTVLLFAVVLITANLTVDIIYFVIDPQIRYD